MREQLKKLKEQSKKLKNSEKSHKDIFKEAAANWIKLKSKKDFKKAIYNYKKSQSK